MLFLKHAQLSSVKELYVNLRTIPDYREDFSINLFLDGCQGKFFFLDMPYDTVHKPFKMI